MKNYKTSSGPVNKWNDCRTPDPFNSIEVSQLQEITLYKWRLTVLFEILTKTNDLS